MKNKVMKISGKKQYDVFISYHRATGADDARLLQQALKARGYNVFFDYDSLHYHPTPHGSEFVMFENSCCNLCS